MMELPRALADFIASEVEAADSRALAAAALELSQRYRALTPPRLESPEDVLAYAAWMLPATHAQVLGALRAVPLRVGDWRPRSLLDLGGGPGTAAWAALEIWPELESIAVVDRERAFLELGARAASHAPWPTLRDASWIEGDLPSAVPPGTADLVILANVLNELPAQRASIVLRRAWQACAGVLLVVEPGTPPGFETVEIARRLAVSLGASVLAPCPHDSPCPLAPASLPSREPPAAGTDWCHFSERHPRPAFQRRVKDATLPYEDAKYSYAVLSRSPSVAPPWARVLRHPWHGKGHAELRLCTAGGIVDRTVGRSAGAGWKLARKLEWGSGVQHEADLGSPPERAPKKERPRERPTKERPPREPRS